MSSQSRTANVAKNTIVSLTCQGLSIILQFVGRTIFIYVLGKDYLGVSGLFTNILTILSFAELGIGSAMVFSLYKPLSENDTEKLKSLMQLYKVAYRYIGIIVGAVGICVIPFLGKIITSQPDISESITLIYLLYLLNTVVSYFFVYKKSIITADQKLYVVNIYQQITSSVQIVLQSVLLVITHDFIIYLIIQVIMTIVNNVVTAHKADRMYPFLKEKAKPLLRDERAEIFKNVRALAVYKFGSVILNGTDNIIISAMFTVADVGVISNYNMVINVFNTLFSRITEGFTASVGNLNAEGDIEKQYQVFQKIFFLCAWLSGFAYVGMALLLNEVVNLWLGVNYTVSSLVALALISSFYVSTVQYAAYTYRTTLGLFVEGRVAPILAAVVNIVLSIALGKMIGLSGIFFATAISRFFTVGVIDAVLIYTKRFKKNPALYFLQYVFYIVLFSIIGLICSFCIKWISISGILGFIIRMIVISFVFNLIMVIVFARTKMFKELKQSFFALIKRKRQN